jgi:thiol-disulfide isomerase/thioredoxin
MNMSLTKSHLVVLGALALAFSGLTTAANTGKIKEGDAFPDLSQFQLEGQLPDSFKGKVVLVDFWASWCGPCKASFAVMEELYKRYNKDGLLIVAVNLDEKRDQMEGFLKSHPASFTIVRDAAKKLVGAVNIGSMPTSFVVDGAGKVHSVHNGFRGEETRKKYLEEIEALLKAR